MAASQNAIVAPWDSAQLRVASPALPPNACFLALNAEFVFPACCLILDAVENRRHELFKLVINVIQTEKMDGE